MRAPGEEGLTAGTRRGTERVTDRQRLVGLLEGMRASRVLLSARVDEREATYNTALLKLDPGIGAIYLDELSPKKGHEAIRTGSTLRLVGVFNGVPTHFTTLVLGIGIKKGIAFYRAAFPEGLDYQQRRVSYRAYVGRALNLLVNLVAEDGREMTGRLLDISQGGLGVHLPRGSSVRVLDMFRIEALELPGQDPISCTAQIRYTLQEPVEHVLRAGARFVDMHPRDRRALVRAILAIEREQIRRSAAGQ